jgi:hypothetical protein
LSDTADLPAYIIAGEWKDAEWVTLSRETQRALSAEELRRVVAGPRRHPYGMEAYQVMVGGECWIFPDRQRAEELAGE